MSAIEALARHPRTAVLVLLAVTMGPAWTWIVLMARDMYGTMQGPSAWMMALVWDWPRVVLLWAMWAVMMAAMMLPSAAPIVLLYAAALRNRGAEITSRVWLLAAGYVVVWAMFSVGATALQRGLAGLFILTPMMELAGPRAGAVVLLIAGLYQLTPFKRVCLRACRSPLACPTQHWRSGRGGAFRMGVEHGLHCLGCCWALMLLLFVGGVMNLTVILVLTAWVLVEKLAPCGEQVARAAGVALIAAAVWIVI